MTFAKDRPRCAWPIGDPLMLAYHDGEWGVPVRDGRELYEHLVLDGMQAGLSWRTILHKRENFRRAFDEFDPRKVARYGPRQVRRLLKDEGIVRNRMKIDAAIANARTFLALDKSGDGDSFAEFLWSFVAGRTIHHRFASLSELPAQTPESQAMSKALRARGFKFVGPTICYAFMQAVGMVNDHVTTCYRWRQLGGGWVRRGEG